MAHDLLIVLALTGLLCAAAYLWQRHHRRGTTRGPWTDNHQPKGGRK